MGDILLQGNTFKNIPAQFNKVVLQRMAGAFILKDNKIEGGDSICSHVSFAKWDKVEQDNLSGGQAKVIVQENGIVYQLTVLDADNLANITKEKITDNVALAFTVTPSMDITGDTEGVKAGVTVLSLDASADVIANLPVVKTIDTKLASTDYEVNALGQLCVKPEAFVNAAASMSQDKIPSAANIVPLPIVSADVKNAGSIAAMAFVLSGKDLKASQASGVKILKILSDENAEFMTYASEDAQVENGSFGVLDMQGNTAGALDSKTSYQLVLFVKDNGSFDLNPQDNAIIDPVAVVGTAAPQQQQYYDGGGSSGCNAGFAALALLLAAPLMTLKKYF